MYLSIRTSKTTWSYIERKAHTHSKNNSAKRKSGGKYRQSNCLNSRIFRTKNGGGLEEQQNFPYLFIMEIGRNSHADLESSKIRERHVPETECNLRLMRGNWRCRLHLVK